jgi:hypothetical protein
MIVDGVAVFVWLYRYIMSAMFLIVVWMHLHHLFATVPLFTNTSSSFSSSSTALLVPYSSYILVSAHDVDSPKAHISNSLPQPDWSAYEIFDIVNAENSTNPPPVLNHTDLIASFSALPIKYYYDSIRREYTLGILGYQILESHPDLAVFIDKRVGNFFFNNSTSNSNSNSNSNAQTFQSVISVPEVDFSKLMVLTLQVVKALAPSIHDLQLDVSSLVDHDTIVRDKLAALHDALFSDWENTVDFRARSQIAENALTLLEVKVFNANLRLSSFDAIRKYRIDAKKRVYDNRHEEVNLFYDTFVIIIFIKYMYCLYIFCDI